MGDPLFQAVHEIVKATKDRLDDEMTTEELKAYHNECDKISSNPAFKDALVRIAVPFADFITTQAKTMEEVYAHRAVLVAIKEIRDFFDTKAIERIEINT